MAKSPTVTTTVTPNVTAGQRANVKSGQRQSMARTVITADMAKNKPDLLAKSINDAVEAAMGGTESGRSNPFSAVTIVQQKLTHGVPVTIRHNLGSQWKHAFVTHAYPGSSIAPVTLIESTTASPVGLTKANSCTVIPAILNTTLSATVTTTTTVTAGSGTYDIMIAAS